MKKPRLLDTVPGFIAVVLVVSTGITLFVDRMREAERSHDDQAATAKLKHYCTVVYAGLDMDADELTNGTPKRQEAAAMRFGELVTYHSEQEIALCAARPVDLSTRGSCMLEHDYACLAKLAHDAAKATKP